MIPFPGDLSRWGMEPVSSLSGEGGDGVEEGQHTAPTEPASCFNLQVQKEPPPLGTWEGAFLPSAATPQGSPSAGTEIKVTPTQLMPTPYISPKLAAMTFYFLC